MEANYPILDDSQIREESLMKNSNMINIEKYNKALIKSICKIDYKEGLGSGFFLKLEQKDKPFYCLVTCAHVLNKKMINSSAKIRIYYDSQQKSINIKLDKTERFIRNYKYMNIDSTIVQILTKDNISDEYFLLPNLDYLNGYEQFKNKKIVIFQFPGGNDLNLSTGNIINVNPNTYELIHSASTEKGSSGSAIFLLNSLFPLAIHRGTNKDINLGYFIGPIINSLKLNLDYQIKNYLNNDTYEGELKNGLKEGYGKYFNYEKEIYYIGQWKNDKKNGKGILYLLNSQKKREIIYEGEFLDDKKEGKGKIFYKNGEYYIGSWVNDIRHGEGKLYFKDNTIKFDGKFEKDTFKEGKFVCNDRIYYVGPFVNGLWSGKGKLFYPNGDLKYEGDFANDDCEGEGKNIYECGDYFVGKFEAGKRKEGILFTKEGNIKYSGSYKNENYDGFGTLISENGEIYEGNFKEGKKNGFGKEFYGNQDNKIKYEGNFVNDKYEGKGKYYDENGEKYDGDFMNGQKNGYGKEFYKSGDIKYEGYFRNDNYHDDKGKFVFEDGGFFIGKFDNGNKVKGAYYFKNGIFKCPKIF